MTVLREELDEKHKAIDELTTTVEKQKDDIKKLKHEKKALSDTNKDLREKIKVFEEVARTILKMDIEIGVDITVVLWMNKTVYECNNNTHIRCTSNNRIRHTSTVVTVVIINLPLPHLHLLPRATRTIVIQTIMNDVVNIIPIHPVPSISTKKASIPRDPGVVVVTAS